MKHDELSYYLMAVTPPPPTPLQMVLGIYWIWICQIVRVIGCCAIRLSLGADCLTCLYISPSVFFQDQEIAMLTEVTHLQEIVEQLCMIAGDPTQLPEASEQLLQDVKTTEGTSFTFQVRIHLHHAHPRPHHAHPPPPPRPHLPPHAPLGIRKW